MRISQEEEEPDENTEDVLISASPLEIEVERVMSENEGTEEQQVERA